jgi:hypothetical protein
MSYNRYTVKEIIEIKDVKVGTTIPDLGRFETPDKLFFTQPEIDATKIVAGISRLDVVDFSLKLLPTEFNSDGFLKNSLQIETILNNINTFFSKVDIYKKLNVFPKRAFLFHGSPGNGKSSIITEISRDLIKNNDTAVLIWPTDKIHASQVTSFLKDCEYAENVKKFILVVEDIGGGEVDVQAQGHADSSLLALLDNVEKTFSIPTLILATTNYPEHLLGNIANRPQRFDEIISIENPTPVRRVELFEFFSQTTLTNELREKVLSKRYNEFSVAYIKECVVRSIVYDIPLEKVLEDLFNQIKDFKNNFKKLSQRMGIE